METGDVDPGERSSGPSGKASAARPSVREVCLVGVASPAGCMHSGDRVTVSGRVYRVAATRARGDDPGDTRTTSTLRPRPKVGHLDRTLGQGTVRSDDSPRFVPVSHRSAVPAPPRTKWPASAIATRRTRPAGGRSWPAGPDDPGRLGRRPRGGRAALGPFHPTAWHFPQRPARGPTRVGPAPRRVRPRDARAALDKPP